MSKNIGSSGCRERYLKNFSECSEKRIGLLGGSFDPVHNGHLTIAQAVQVAHSLDIIVFVPARKNPLKTAAVRVSDQQRLSMLELALSQSQNFYISTIELERDGKSYSYITASEIHAQAPSATLFWIGGFDNLRDQSDRKSSLAHWHEKDKLLDLVHFVICTRQDSAKTPSDSYNMKQEILDLDARLYSERQKLSLIKHLVEIPPVQASSTAIREMCQQGQYQELPVPEQVREYIERQKLYSS